jgi:AcrR family transcriptional regulator
VELFNHFLLILKLEKVDRKSEIIHISAKLFRERGYKAVSMRDIAKSLDIKAASLYNHIQSKQEILMLLIINIAEEFTREMHLLNESNETAIDSLKKLIDIHIDITLRDPDAIACLNNDWMHLDKEHRTYYVKMRDEYEENVRKIVKRGIDNGEIKEHNIEVIVFSMLSTLRTFYLWYGRKMKLNPTEFKESLTHVLMQGIV